jgi:RNA polymerase sigma-70 factor (ECF subfamily)
MAVFVPNRAGNVDLPMVFMGAADAVCAERAETLTIEEQTAKLYDEMSDALFRHLVCLRISPQEAEELIQETFLRLYKHLHSAGDQSNLRAWVFSVAHNLAMDVLKSCRHALETSPEGWAELCAARVETAPNPEELLLLKEKMIRLHAEMSALPELQQQTLLLRMEGFRYREIADILGVTISTVAECLRRSVSKLTKEPHD